MHSLIARLRHPADSPVRPRTASSPERDIRVAECKATGLCLSIRPLESAQEMLEEWSALAMRPLVPNIFYEPEMALPARVPFGRGIKVLAIHASGASARPLLGLWPFRVSNLRWGVPLPIMVGWSHPFSHCGVPLLDRERAQEAAAAMLHLPVSFPDLPARALLPLVPDRGPFDEVLRHIQTGLGIREARLERHDRAILTPGKAIDPLAHLSSGSRSKMRQELRRLEKQGRVTLETAVELPGLAAALDNYLELEASGWKGRAGTAIPSSPAEMKFMRAVVENLGRQGRVRIDELKVGERVIASSITYRHGSAAWYAKISFDEAFAKNSPGSQLVLKVTEALNADASISLVDSCAPPLHPLMRRFWSERMELSNRLVEFAGGDRLLGFAAQLERRRPLARDYYHRARRWLKAARAPKPKPD